MHIINADTITNITVFGKEIEDNYKWFEKSSFTLNPFKRLHKKAGFYAVDKIFHDDTFIADTVKGFLDSNCYEGVPNIGYVPRSDFHLIGEDNRTVYTKPRVKIYTADGKYKTVYFPTVDEAGKFVKGLLDKIPHNVNVS